MVQCYVVLRNKYVALLTETPQDAKNKCFNTYVNI
jgi:hypothetical protein